MNRQKLLSDRQKNVIKAIYLETYSITDVMKSTELKGIGRIPIKRFLTEIGLYEGINGPNQQKKKQEKIQATMLGRYGVINNGQRPGQGFGSRNKIPYHKIDFLDTQYQEFRKKVERNTKRNLSKLPIPEYCYYTGVKFSDEDNDQVNPNDPRKRTIDHKISIITGYLMGMSVDELASTDNLCYCLRYVNTIKGNTSYKDFMGIAKYITEVFKKEGYEVNE